MRVQRGSVRAHTLNFGLGGGFADAEAMCNLYFIYMCVTQIAP